MKFQPEFYTETSILSIEKLVDWKKKQSFYNFSSLPSTVIIDGFGTKKPFLKNKKIKGIKGSHHLSKNKDYLLSSSIGNGAPDLITLCEELKCLGVKNFIFIGVSGMISNKIEEGNCMVVDKAISGVGTTQYYSNEQLFNQTYSTWTKAILAVLKLKKVTCFSTDAPFRETKYLINELKSKEVDCIEMECASLFAFAEFHKVNSLCFLFGADRITSDWTPPKKYGTIIKEKQKLIKKLINLKHE